MAHEISIIGGIAEAMYAKEPAWHGLGKVLSDAPNSDTAIREAHLDWPVELEPVAVRGVDVPGYWATVRQDTGATLGIVGDRYSVIQNREAFDFMDSLLQDGIMKYEAAMALRGGREVCLVARMPSVDSVAEGDNLLRYIMFSTSHDGTGSIRAVPTSVRVVCANTKRLALEKASAKNTGCSIRHTGDLTERLDIVRQYLSQFDKQFTLFRDTAGLLATKRFSREEKLAYLAELFPQPINKETKLPATEGRGHTLWLKKRQKIEEMLRSDTNSLPSMAGTWWALYNAVSEVVDHHSSYKGDNKAENRYLSVIDGPGAAQKDGAFDLALAMSA